MTGRTPRVCREVILAFYEGAARTAFSAIPGVLRSHVMRRPVSNRAITMRWISLVPS